MILAIIGLVWHYKGPAFPVDFVTTIVLNVSMPALLFHTLATSVVDVVSLGRMAVATMVLHAVFTSVTVCLLKLSGKDWRLCVTHVVGNTGNLGLPVCLLAFGAEGLAYAMTFFAVQCILLFTAGEAVLAGSISFSRVLRSPIIYAVCLGVLVRVFNLQLPELAMQTTQLLGQIVIPLMLITLGISLAGMRASQLPSTIVWSFVRTLLAVVIGFGVAELMQLDGVARGVLIIQTVVPVAVFNYLLAVRHERDSTETSGMILVTHIASVIYLPVVLGLLL